MSDAAQCQNFIKEFGFGVVVSNDLTGSHLPFILKQNEGQLGTLYTHCARANPHWKTLENEEALIVFSGPHSYISPRWYSTSPAVPTWNYVTVHAKGKVTMLSDSETLRAMGELVIKYEPELAITKNIITDEYKQKLLAGLVAFRIEITQLQGKQKLGQQKPASDQKGVYQALANSQNINDNALANYMEKVNLGMGI